jgi:hypothetical protein
MTEAQLPERLREFITRHISSIAQLEALLLLRRDPELEWSADMVARRLYASEQVAAEVLSRLHTDGFLTHAGGLYRYRNDTTEQTELVGLLEVAYSRHLIPVTELIHTKTRSIREFADAFKFRKDR